MRKKEAKFIVCLLLLSLGCALGACSVRPRPARTEDGEALFRLGFSGTPDSLNPYAAGNEESAAVLSLLYDTLFSVDPVTGEYEGSLCREWTVTDGAARGGKLWRLTLQEGVAWHDGQPLTASDVEFSLQSAKDFSNLYSYPELALLDTTGIAVEDDTHLAFLVWGDVPYMEELLSRVPILPRHIWNQTEGMDYNSSGIPSNYPLARETLYAVPADRGTMIGSGLYIWDGMENNVVTLRRNESYWGGSARGAVVELHFGCDDTAELYRSKKLDACWDLSEEGFEALRAQGRGVFTEGTEGELYSLSFFLGDSGTPLASENVRRAIDYCLDRSAVLTCFGGGMPSIGYLTPYSPWYYEDAIEERRDFSPDSAAWLLESAGYRDSDGDGVREAGAGRTLSFDLLCSDAVPAWAEAAETLRAACASAGIKIRVRALPPEELYAAVGKGDYDLLLSAQRCYNDPFYSFGTFYWNGGDNAFSASGLYGRVVSPGWNYTGYQNEGYDALYRDMLVLTGQERRDVIEEMGGFLYDAAISLPIGFSVDRQICSPAWFNARAYRGTGLYFAPEILRQQLLGISAAGRK